MKNSEILTNMFDNQERAIKLSALVLIIIVKLGKNVESIEVSEIIDMVVEWLNTDSVDYGTPFKFNEKILS